MLYIPQIRAADHGEPQRHETTRVSVQVVEAPKASKNPPVFKTNNQTVKVTESDKAGFLVALVQASDKDGDSLRYDILGKKSRAFFTHKVLQLYQSASYFLEFIFNTTTSNRSEYFSLSQKRAPPDVL